MHGAAQVIPAIEQLIEQTENQISLLLGGSPAPSPRQSRLTEQQQPPSVPAGLPSALLDRRPDIRAAEQNLVAANAIIGVAKAAYFPRISLTGLLGFQSDQLSSLFTGPARVWQFVPQVSQPIFNGGPLRSNVRLAEAQEQIALIQYERAIQTAFREVSDALVQYQKVREIRAKQEQLVATLQDRSRAVLCAVRGRHRHAAERTRCRSRSVRGRAAARPDQTRRAAGARAAVSGARRRLAGGLARHTNRLSREDFARTQRTLTEERHIESLESPEPAARERRELAEPGARRKAQGVCSMVVTQLSRARRVWLVLTAVALTTVCAARAASAQAERRVVVVEESGGTIAGAQLLLRSASGVVLHQATTIVRWDLHHRRASVGTVLAGSVGAQLPGAPRAPSSSRRPTRHPPGSCSRWPAFRAT